MKRSRLYLSLSFLVASQQVEFSSAAALRARLSPADDANNDSQTKAHLLTAKLSSSSHHRALQVSNHGGSQEDLSIPLVGIGVGNSPHHKIPFILASALMFQNTNNKQNANAEDLHYRMIDTSHSHTDSALEVLVGRSLSRLLSSGSKSKSSSSTTDGDDVYHVLIKINHSHLGYERTMLSIQNSLSDILPSFNGKSGTSTAVSTPNFRVHAIIQYPRCYDSFFTSKTYQNSPNFPTKYSSCTEEEEALDEATKSVGPSPLLDTGAWKRSWHALEELYHHGTLESIGVSNFGPHDMKRLYEMSTVGPHIYQGTLHTLLLEEDLIEEMVMHGVHYQCIDAASTILAGKETAPKAYATLERIGAMHGSLDEGEGVSGVYGYSPIQVVLGWLVQRGVGVVPGTTNPAHLAENSPVSLASMPKFSPRENLDIENAILAIVNGEDESDAESGELASITQAELGSQAENVEVTATGNQLDGGVIATFFNTFHRNIRIFQVHPETGRQIQLSRSIPPGRSGRLIVRPDDVLIAYDGHGVAVKKFLVEGSSEGRIDFSMDSAR